MSKERECCVGTVATDQHCSLHGLDSAVQPERAAWWLRLKRL